MKIRPEVRVFIQALRDGKDAPHAFVEYCWARDAVCITLDDLEHFGDPFKCPPQWCNLMAPAMGADAFDEGADDEAIAAAFAKGSEYDGGRSIVWRAMTDTERPTTGDLVRSMGGDERETAAELLGYVYIAKALASAARYY